MKKNNKKTKENIEDDIVFEEDVLGGAETIKKLREKLKKCTKEKQEYLDGWQRAKADFVNAKKENEESKKNFSSFAKEGFAIDIITAMDSFDMAFSDKGVWEKVDENWRKGVEYIYTQLKTALENNDVSEILGEGENFDPNLHMAIESLDAKDKNKDGIVANVIQKGYKINDRVIRPARVKVFQYNIPADKA